MSMSRETILVVDGEKDVLKALTAALEEQSYQVLSAGTGEDGLKTATDSGPDLVILDLSLPDMDGFEFCRALKRRTATARIRLIMLASRSEEADVVAGLELGADDFIAKPFSPRVMLARVKAVLRRPGMDELAEQEVRLDDLVIDPDRHLVLVRDGPVELTLTEFRILHCLARRPGWVFTRYQIVDVVHGKEYDVTDRSVDVQIAGLRKKLGPLAERIETVRGVGYRFRM